MKDENHRLRVNLCENIIDSMEEITKVSESLECHTSGNIQSHKLNMFGC
jgi:hypothetical protein